MTYKKQSPFSANLLNSAPTQQNIKSVEKGQKKEQKQQQSKAAKADQQQNIAVQIATMGKPFWWMLFMFICSVLYLLPEAVFNAALTNVAGGLTSREEDLRAVELFGRTISGIGVTLLLADLLLKGKQVAKVTRAFGYFTLITVLAWPTVFFGQKWLVDHFIVDASSPEERQQAYLSQVLRSALIEKSIQFEGIDYDPDKQHSATEKTFLSVFGGLVHADDKLIDELKQKKQLIMEKLVRDRAMSHFEQHYADYADFRESLRAKYTEYANGSKKYNKVITDTQKQSDSYWLDTQNQVKQGWEKYQQGVAAYQARVESRAQKIAPKIHDYFERRNKCADQKKNSSKVRCFNRLQKSYDKEIAKYKIPYIPPDDWLIREEISTSENVGNSIINGIMTFGLYTAMQVTDALTGGDAGFKDHRMVYTNDVNHYKNVLMEKMQPDFIKQSAGYPFGISSIHQFRTNPLTSIKVNKKLKQKGLILPASWSINDRDSFDRVVAKKVRQEANTEWRSTMKAKGNDMQPNLSWKQFQLEASIQKRIQRKMKELYVNPTLADWNNRQFKQKIVEPNIKRKTSEYLNVLAAQQVEFADGGAFESTGKSALRATIIPPISMSLSLALVLLTLLKLPFKILQLVQAKRMTAQTNSKPKGYITVFISMMLMLSVFLLPLTLPGNQYTMKGSAMHYFFEQMEKNDSAAISFTLKWLLITQPIVQPIGSSIDQRLFISKGFDAISELINHFDLAIMPEGDDNHKGTKQQAQTAANYQTVRKWVYLKADQTEFSFKL